MSVNFVTRLHKAIKNADGKHPVVLQITWGNNVRRKRTGIWVSPSQFYLDDDQQARLRDIHGRREKQKELDSMKRTAVRVYEDHFEGEEFDYNKFSRLFIMKPEKEEKTIMKVSEFCTLVSEKFVKTGQIRSSLDYKTLANIILKVSPKDIFFDDFTMDWLYKFEDYFNERGTRGFNTMNRLKILFGKAVQAKVADFTKNPFKNPYTNPYGYDISKLKKKRIARVNTNRIKDLNLDQLKKLREYEPRTEKEKEYLMVFWFSFYTMGVNLTDVAQLEKKDIKDNRWYYERSKTGTGLKRGKPLLPEALKIVENMMKLHPRSKYIFPIISSKHKTEMDMVKRVNDYASCIRKTASRISKRLGFDGYFTYYSARYSSATLALNMGADRNTVSHLLDHANFSTIDHYAGRADDGKVLEVMEMLRI